MDQKNKLIKGKSFRRVSFLIKAGTAFIKNGLKANKPNSISLLAASVESPNE